MHDRKCSFSYFIKFQLFLSCWRICASVVVFFWTSRFSLIKVIYYLSQPSIIYYNRAKCRSTNVLLLKMMNIHVIRNSCQIWSPKSAVIKSKTSRLESIEFDKKLKIFWSWETFLKLWLFSNRIRPILRWYSMFVLNISPATCWTMLGSLVSSFLEFSILKMFTYMFIVITRCCLQFIEYKSITSRSQLQLMETGVHFARMYYYRFINYWY